MPNWVGAIDVSLDALDWAEEVRTGARLARAQGGAASNSSESGQVERR